MRSPDPIGMGGGFRSWMGRMGRDGLAVWSRVTTGTELGRLPGSTTWDRSLRAWHGAHVGLELGSIRDSTHRKSVGAQSRLVCVSGFPSFRGLRPRSSSVTCSSTWLGDLSPTHPRHTALYCDLDCGGSSTGRALGCGPGYWVRVPPPPLPVPGRYSSGGFVHAGPSYILS